VVYSCHVQLILSSHVLYAIPPKHLSECTAIRPPLTVPYSISIDHGNLGGLGTAGLEQTGFAGPGPAGKVLTVCHGCGGSGGTPDKLSTACTELPLSTWY
jgi:hypothetical protein